MRRILILFLSISMIGQTLFAQSSAILEYIDKYKSIALKHERDYGIPAPITLAQGILESSAGTSELARSSNNHFGIKRGKSWTGPCVYFWDDESEKSAFRKYDTVEESFEDHAQILLNNHTYDELFSKSVFDYRGWANGLQRAGYATSPTYAKALIGYIDAYQLYAINGGVKLRPGKKTVIKKTITIEGIVNGPEIIMDEEERSEEEKEVEATTEQMGLVVEINRVRCTMLYPGETLSSIALKYDIAKSKILEYNESTSEQDFKEGDIIFLAKKRNKYHGAKDTYRVQEGESIYQISQQYGIRVSRLCKMNNLTIFSTLSEGQELKLK